MIVRPVVIVSVVVAAVVGAVVVGDGGRVSFMRLLMIVNWLLSTFAVEYKLFFISFARILTPNVLKWIPFMTFARILPDIESRKFFVLTKFDPVYLLSFWSTLFTSI